MRQAIGVSVGTASVLILLIWVLPIEKLLQGLLVDDAFYYLQVARVFAQKGILSFDGVHETNGFHPLWMLILLPFAFLVHEPESFVTENFWCKSNQCGIESIGFATVPLHMLCV